MTYRVRTVAEMTGIPRNTLIAWERRYGFVRPARHENGYRAYSDEDVAKLVRIRNMTGSGLSISEAVRVMEAEERGKVGRDDSPVDRAAFESERGALLAALVEYRAADAERILAHLVGLPFETRVEGIFFPLLREIGERWERGILSVAQEHFATAVVRDQISSMMLVMGQRGRRARHAACTTLPGELHELGALAGAARLALVGYRATYLGPNLPVDELAEFCHGQRPDLVCISALVRQERALVQEYARTLRARAPTRARLVIGGRGISMDPPPNVEGVEFVVDWRDLMT